MKLKSHVFGNDDKMEVLLDKDDPHHGKLSEDFEEDEEEWVDMWNEDTKEWNGPRYGEPTKYGDWQSKGRTTDFS